MVADPAAGYTAAAMAVPANEASGLEEFGLPRPDRSLHAAWQKWRLVLLRGLGPLLLLAAWQITAMYGRRFRRKSCPRRSTSLQRSAS